MERLNGFNANLAAAVKWGHETRECCAKCGRFLRADTKSKHSGIASMPKMHLRGACQRVDRFQAANRIESMNVEATRVYMSRKAI